jgi:anti-sigma regulatory factor (Ser/Thr protein kinase)
MAPLQGQVLEADINDRFEKSNVIRFRTGAAMLARLGSEQLKDEITAVIELVKNAYDADARTVRLELRDTDEALLRIQDDGAGMTQDDLESKWAFLATDNKLREDRSPIFGRKRLGQKGVGRFAAEKLGEELILRTRVKGQERVLQVKFEWDELSGDRELGEYEFPVKLKKPDNFEPISGTRLDIRRLRVSWKKSRVEKLRGGCPALS